MIRHEQNSLFKLLVPHKDHNLQVKFDFQLEFDHNGNIVPSPSFEDYTIHIMSLYDGIRKKVINDKNVVEEFLMDVVTIANDQLETKLGFCQSPVEYIKRKSFCKQEKDMLEKSLASNIKKANDYLFNFRTFSSINDLVKDTESHFQTTKK